MLTETAMEKLGACVQGPTESAASFGNTMIELVRSAMAGEEETCSRTSGTMLLAGPRTSRASSRKTRGRLPSNSLMEFSYSRYIALVSPALLWARTEDSPK